jgi:hypothetical protein
MQRNGCGLRTPLFGGELISALRYPPKFDPPECSGSRRLADCIDAIRHDRPNPPPRQCPKPLRIPTCAAGVELAATPVSAAMSLSFYPDASGPDLIVGSLLQHWPEGTLLPRSRSVPRLPDRGGLRLGVGESQLLLAEGGVMLLLDGPVGRCAGNAYFHCCAVEIPDHRVVARGTLLQQAATLQDAWLCQL